MTSSNPLDISKAVGESGSTWYKYLTLSHGFGARPYYDNGTTIYYYNVYLRVFIDWIPCGFSAQTGGTVSRGSITVPSDYTSATEDGDTLTIYGINITATANDGYTFIGWSNGGNNYVAQFELGALELAFFDDDNLTYDNANLSKLLCGVKNGSSYSYSTGTEFRFEVARNSTVQFDFLNTHSKCSYTINKTSCYAVVKVNFRGKILDNETFEAESTAKDYEMLFIITSPSHYITSCVDVSTPIANADKNVTLSDNLYVWIQLALKSYNVTFG